MKNTHSHTHTHLYATDSLKPGISLQNMAVSGFTWSPLRWPDPWTVERYDDEIRVFCSMDSAFLSGIAFYRILLRDGGNSEDLPPNQEFEESCIILILSDIITYYVSKVAWWFMGFSLCLFLEQDGYWRHVTTPSSLRTTSQIGLGVDLLEIMLIQFQKLD